MGTSVKFSDSSLNNISENDESSDFHEISSIPSTSSSKQSNMTLIDASCLSPLLRKVISEHEDKLFARLEQTFNLNKNDLKNSVKSPRRSPRFLPKEQTPPSTQNNNAPTGCQI